METLLEEGQLRSDALPLAHEHPICHQRREAADRVCQHCGVLSKGNERGFFCCCGVSAPRPPRAPHSMAASSLSHHPTRAGLRLLHVHRVRDERFLPSAHSQAQVPAAADLARRVVALQRVPSRPGVPARGGVRAPRHSRRRQSAHRQTCGPRTDGHRLLGGELTLTLALNLTLALTLT